MFKHIKRLLSKYQYWLISSVLKRNGYTDYRTLHPHVFSDKCFEKVLIGDIVNIIKIYHDEDVDKYFVCSALYKQGSDDIQYNTFCPKYGKCFNAYDMLIILKMTNEFKENSEKGIIDNRWCYNIDYYVSNSGNIDRFIDHFNGKTENLYLFVAQTVKEIKNSSKTGY